MIIKFDERIELMGVLQFLSNYSNIVPFPIINKKENEYTNLIHQYFSNVKKHPIFSIIDELTLKGFNFDAPYYFMYNTNKEFVFQPGENSAYIQTRITAEDSIRLSKSINEFYKESNFRQFTISNSNLYEKIVKTFSLILGNVDICSELSDYLKADTSNSEIILSIINNGNFGLKNEINEKIGSIIGLMGETENISLDSFYIRTLSWHEFCHSIINPIVESNGLVVKKYSYLFNVIQDKMSMQAYGDWTTTVIEHLIRGVVNRLVLRFYGNDYYERANKREYENGFIYLSPILEYLEVYEKMNNITFTTFCEQNIQNLFIRLTQFST